MGIWFSSPNKIVEEMSGTVPEDARTVKNGTPIVIRHRPTCLSSDLEMGITEALEKPGGDHTKAQ